MTQFSKEMNNTFVAFFSQLQTGGPSSSAGAASSADLKTIQMQISDLDSEVEKLKQASENMSSKQALFKVHQTSIRITLADLESNIINLNSQQAIPLADTSIYSSSNSKSLNSRTNLDNNSNNYNNNNNNNDINSGRDYPKVRDLQYYSTSGTRGQINVFWEAPEINDRSLLLTYYELDVWKFGPSTNRKVLNYTTRGTDKLLRESHFFLF